MSSNSTHGAIVVAGSGPGIGSAFAAHFASQGFSKAILLSRDASRLSSDAETVRAAAPGAEVDIVTVDLADTASVPKALEEVDRKLKGTPLEVVLFNAARVGVSNLIEWSVGELESDLKIAVISCYAVAQWALPQLLKLANSPPHKPAFFVTSGLLHKDPFPHLFSLSACKAAQYSLVHSMYKEYTGKGVHCALIVVGGKVSDEAKVCNKSNIAQETWKLYLQEKGKWDLDIEMLDPDYADHVKNRREEASGSGYDDEIWKARRT